MKVPGCKQSLFSSRFLVARRSAITFSSPSQLSPSSLPPAGHLISYMLHKLITYMLHLLNLSYPLFLGLAMFLLLCDALKSETSLSHLASRPSSCRSLPCCQAPSSTGPSLTTLACSGRWTLWFYLLFRRNVCVLLLLLLLTNTLIHLPFHRRNVGRRQTACSTTPTCEFLARHQFQPTWWKPSLWSQKFFI